MKLYKYGKVISQGKRYIIFESNYEGLIINVNYPQNFAVNKNMKIFIYEYKTEYNKAIYGFSYFNERVVFEDLLSISGIGPKTAMFIIAKGSQRIVNAIIDKNTNILTEIQSVGESTANHIIYELRPKYVKMKGIKEGKIAPGEIINSLKTLGFSKSQIDFALTKIEPAEKIEDMLKKQLSSFPMNINLRPENFKQFIGQTRLKETLKVLIKSAQSRKQQLDHILFYGKAGLGKTSLAIIIAKTLGAKVKFAQGPLLEKKSDILSLFSSVTNGDIIFIDEIHGINKNVEELIYSALEEQTIDITVGPDGDQRIVRMKLPNFTLIGATTKRGKLSIPLKERFGLLAQIHNYNVAELKQVVFNAAKKLKVEIDEESQTIIAEHGKSNPRLAITILKRAIDFMVYQNKIIINKKILNKTFKAIGLYKYGLSDMHINYLNILNDVFTKKWVSIETLSGMIQETKENIEQEIELDLLENHLITKTSRGRKITPNGINYLLSI